MEKGSSQAIRSSHEDKGNNCHETFSLKILTKSNLRAATNWTPPKKTTKCQINELPHKNNQVPNKWTPPSKNQIIEKVSDVEKRTCPSAKAGVFPHQLCQPPEFLEGFVSLGQPLERIQVRKRVSISGEQKKCTQRVVWCGETSFFSIFFCKIWGNT